MYDEEKITVQDDLAQKTESFDYGISSTEKMRRHLVGGTTISDPVDTRALFGWGGTM